MDQERMVSDELQDEEEYLDEMSLRPQRLEQYIGQEKLKKEINIYIQAAKNRSEALDHVLLYGPPGLGKTTMAMVIANEMGTSIRTTSGPAIDKAGDIVALLNDLEPGGILFIDEIPIDSASIMVWLIPAITVGSESGNCTLNSFWRRVAP